MAKKKKAAKGAVQLIVPVTTPGGIFEVMVRKAGPIHRWVISPGRENFIFCALIEKKASLLHRGYSFRLERGILPREWAANGIAKTEKEALAACVGMSLGIAGYIGSVVGPSDPSAIGEWNDLQLTSGEFRARAPREKRGRMKSAAPATVETLQQALLETDQRMRELLDRVNALELELIKRP